MRTKSLLYRILRLSNDIKRCGEAASAGGSHAARTARRPVGSPAGCSDEAAGEHDTELVAWALGGVLQPAAGVGVQPERRYRS